MSSLYSVFNVLVGGDKRNRTAGLLLARQALSQLSYKPKCIGRFLFKSDLSKFDELGKLNSVPYL